MKETLRKLFSDRLREEYKSSGLFTPDKVEVIVEEILAYIDGTLKDVYLLSTLDLQGWLNEENLLKKITSSKYTDTLMAQFAKYVDYRRKIEEAYQKTKNWAEVFNSCDGFIYTSSAEAFVDIVERQYNTKVKDGKHLFELTGMFDLYKYWDKEDGFLSEDEAKKLAKREKKTLRSYLTTEEKNKEEIIKELNSVLITARSEKYDRALRGVISSGGKYKDLLNINPKNYGLPPETWGEYYFQSKKGSILQAISEELLLHYVGGLVSKPSLRAISEELEAPYSVIMEAYKFKGSEIIKEEKHPKKNGTTGD